MRTLAFSLALKLALSMGIAAGVTGALANEAHAADSASIKLSVIRASKKAGSNDPALRRIQGKLKRAFSGHKSFKQLAKHKFDLQLRKSRKIKLPNGQTASFTYLGKSKTSHQFQVSIPRSRVNMKVSVKSKGIFFIAKRGFKHKNDDMIVAVYLR